EITFDAAGLDLDPAALNEALADAWAEASKGVEDPCLAKFVGEQFGLACLRNADRFLTCQGRGPTDPDDPGRVDEIHTDGNIWAAYVWEVGTVAAALGPGGRTQVAQALTLAAELLPPHPTFSQLQSAFEQQLRDVGGPIAGDYAACAAARRDLR